MLQNVKVEAIDVFPANDRTTLETKCADDLVTKIASVSIMLAYTLYFRWEYFYHRWSAKLQRRGAICVKCWESNTDISWRIKFKILSLVWEDFADIYLYFTMFSKDPYDGGTIWDMLSDTLTTTKISCYR